MTGKLPITITYRKPGTQPPLFVAGTFTEPPWTAQEMEYTTGSDGVHSFSHTCSVELGTEIQYKFRVGTGNWWVLKEDSPTVTDSAGNQNNVLKATASSATPKAANDVISHEHQNQNGTEATEQGAVFDGDYVNVHHDSTDNLIKNGPPEAQDTKAATGLGERENGTTERATTRVPASDEPSAPKEDKPRGWISTIIRTIFVDWIGGFFRRLFGRRQAPTQ